MKDHEQNHIIRLAREFKYAVENDSSYNKLNDHQETAGEHMEEQSHQTQKEVNEEINKA